MVKGLCLKIGNKIDRQNSYKAVQSFLSMQTKDILDVLPTDLFELIGIKSVSGLIIHTIFQLIFKI